VPALSVAAGSTLDLTNNDLIIDYSGSSPLASTILPALVSGYASGSWNGTGITSSTAAAVAADSSQTHKTAIGFAEASTLGVTTFSGQTVDTTAILFRYTVYGDANLDGVVDTLDFNSLAANFGGTGKLWNQADFNYDGVVDTLDFNFLAANFGQSVAGSANASVSDASPLGSPVPEPASLAALALGAGVLLARRRRREPSDIATR
jgi:hypothetical protein